MHPLRLGFHIVLFILALSHPTGKPAGFQSGQNTIDQLDRYLCTGTSRHLRHTKITVVGRHATSRKFKTNETRASVPKKACSEYLIGRKKRNGRTARLGRPHKVHLEERDERENSK